MQLLKAVVTASLVTVGAWTWGCTETTVADPEGGTSAGDPSGERALGEGSLSCEPSADDTACESCTRSKCCGELETYAGASSAAAFEACVEPCADQACVDACADTSPAAGAAYAELYGCQSDSCAEPCVCEAMSDDTACLACVKEHCCSDLVPYALASDFDGFSTCMEPCADRACAEGCIEEFPDAGPAYAAYSDCAVEACPAECE